MRLLIALIASFWLTGCASQPYSAVAADAATTATGLSMAGVAEMNPLGWATVPLRIAVIERAKTMPIEHGTPVLHMTSAVGWGAATNNLLVMAGAGPLSIVAGIVVGIGVWQDGERERQFWSNCAQHRKLEPDKTLECVWVKT